MAWWGRGYIWSHHMIKVTAAYTYDLCASRSNAHGVWHPCCLETFYLNRASDNIFEFLSPWIPITPCHRTDSYDHFSTVMIIFRQLRSYLLDSYDHVADDWFVSYDHITKVSQAHISKTNAQTSKSWHAKPRLYHCVQIREHSVAYKRQNRARPELTVADVRHLVWS